MYLTNRNLFALIQSNKYRTCSYLDDSALDISPWRDGPSRLAILKAGTDLDQWIREHGEVGMVIRVMTDEHIPDFECERVKKRSRAQHPAPYPPFKHYRLDLDLDGQLTATEVLRSNWRGGFDNGCFDPTIRTNDAFGRAALLMVERVARKPNFKNYSYSDEMKSDAIVQMCAGGLKFDESKSDNTFAYWTTIVVNCFVRRLNIEKRVQHQRDDLLELAGAVPSSSRQTDDWCTAHHIGFTDLAPHQKKVRRGRPAIAESTRRAIIADRANGLTFKAIAERHGLSPGYVQSLTRKPQ